MNYTKSSIYCVYAGCKNKRHRKKYSNIPNLIFYQFPVNDQKRCKMWILNCGNSELLDLPDDRLKYQLICEQHFLESSFRDFRAAKKFLNKHAVPVKYKSADEAQQATVKKEMEGGENILFSDWNIAEENGQCPYCEFEFSSIDLKNRHVKAVHIRQLEQDTDTINQNENKNANIIICAPCREAAMKFGTYVCLQKHLESSHNIKLEIISIDFFFEEIYENWLKKQEIETSYEILSTIKKADRVEKYFICKHNNTTEYQSHYNLWNEETDGFTKIYAVCPSRLVVKLLINGKTSVTFWKTHVGHEERISSCHLRNEEKRMLDNKLISEVTADQFKLCSTENHNMTNGQYHDNAVVSVKEEAASEDEESTREMEIRKVSNFLRNLDDSNYSKCMEEIIVPMMEKVNQSAN